MIKQSKLWEKHLDAVHAKVSKITEPYMTYKYAAKGHKIKLEDISDMLDAMTAALLFKPTEVCRVDACNANLACLFKQLDSLEPLAKRACKMLDTHLNVFFCGGLFALEAQYRGDSFSQAEYFLCKPCGDELFRIPRYVDEDDKCFEELYSFLCEWDSNYFEGFKQKVACDIGFSFTRSFRYID